MKARHCAQNLLSRLHAVVAECTRAEVPLHCLCQRAGRRGLATTVLLLCYGPTRQRVSCNGTGLKLLTRPPSCRLNKRLLGRADGRPPSALPLLDLPGGIRVTDKTSSKRVSNFKVAMGYATGLRKRSAAQRSQSPAFIRSCNSSQAS